MNPSIDGEALPRLVRPIAFDAGIDSYAAVAALRRLLPDQDILYLADRASFPYGGKCRPSLLTLLRCMRQAMPLAIAVQVRLFGEAGAPGGELLAALVRIVRKHRGAARQPDHDPAGWGRVA